MRRVLGGCHGTSLPHRRPASATELAAFTPNGRVTVEGTDTSTVDVTATKRTTYRGGDLDAADVVTEVVSDTVRVRVVKSTAQWRTVAVDLAIDLPAKLVTAHVTTGNGDVTLAGGPGGARAWTGNGAIDAEIRAVDGVSSLGCGSGDVTARVATDLACTLDLSTGNGRVETDALAVTTATSRRGHLSGALNAGGDAVLRATTGNGDVSLRPLDDERASAATTYNW